MIELKSIEIDIILNLNRNHCLIELKTKYSHHRSLPKPPSLTISVKYVFFFSSFPIKIFNDIFTFVSEKKHKVPVPYPGLVNISSMLYK
jgi:hypothetical protein